MKLGPATKLDKRNKATSKTFKDDVMSANCDVIIIFPIYDQFGLIRCVVISDLYLFQDIALLNPYFKFSKNLMSLLIDKVTKGT